MKSLIFLGFIMVFCLGQSVRADEETDKAISEVQQQMQHADFKEKAKNNSKEAPQVIQNVKQLSGSTENEAEIYKLASEIMGNFKGKSVEEMQKALEAAKVNPENFANSLTPEQKIKLKELSERLPAANTKKP